MNLPDVTLFFQMIHFFIAYRVLRRFVFAPALTIIEAGELRKDQLQKRVDMARENHLELQHQQRQKWRFIQRSLSDMIPKINEKKCVNQTKISEPVPLTERVLSSQQKQEIRQMLHDELLDVRR